MNSKHSIIIVSFLLSNTFYTQPFQEFIPSKKACGADVQEEKEEITIPDTDRLISCMIAGYRDVSWVNKSGLALLNPNLKPLKKHNIRKIYDYNNMPILYTPKGEKNARLLARYIQHRNQKKDYYDTQESPNLKKAIKSVRVLNAYLLGTLLGYDLKDIKYFYQTKNVRRNIEHDKKNAKKFIRNNTPIVEKEMQAPLAQRKKIYH